eukprot:CAMPEP_0174273964 /NCGR_PEP_ID=MMETSP0439-20130205/56428_1 /TAXON_ID=0 /ORGANISM="Stereomyxa ramosa, Strain Chinc5" /LENGTH=123 /DNA_ID=CAMNT_0015365471 /DNA_START=54 /DNA_END=425 /DNA_ORIENTATION=+
MEELEVEMEKLTGVFVETQRLIEYQQQLLDNCEAHISDCELGVASGVKEICNASKYSSVMMPVAAAALGGIVAGPVGAFALGAKGLVAGLGVGAVVGGVVGNDVAKKQRRDAEEVLVVINKNN